MTTEKEITNLEHSELLALYQVTAQDLIFFKGQQWNLTNYTSLALAAIVGIAQSLGSTLPSCTRLALSIIASAVFLSALWVLWRLNASIKERQDRLKRLFPNLSERFRNVRGEKTAISATEISIFLTGALCFGVCLVWWLVYFRV